MFKHQNTREQYSRIYTSRFKRSEKYAKHQSAKKRVKVNAKKAAANKAANSALKTAIKKANVAIETNAADKDVLVKDAVKKIDKAAANNLIHKNCAARKKSNLAKKVNA